MVLLCLGLEKNIVSPMKKSFLFIVGFIVSISSSYAASFTDVPEDSPSYAAIESLKNLSIINGFPDGTFQPSNPVTRAEALKMILLSAKISTDDTVGKGTGFADVTSDAWYSAFTLKGKELGIIKGYGDTGKFFPNNQVTKAEFLKMLFQAFQLDTSKHEGLTAAISADTNVGEWYLPYLSYAKTIGVITPSIDNKLFPNSPQTRSDCAEIIYKLLVIQRGGEVQKMLNITESHLVNVLVGLNGGDIDAALQSANDAVFFSEKALAADSSQGLVKAANKIALGFKELCLAYKAGVDGDGDLLVQHVNEAKRLAGAAFDDHNSTQQLGKKIKTQADILLQQVQQKAAQ